MCKELVWILRDPQVHLSKTSTSVTITEDEAVVWQEQKYKPPHLSIWMPKLPQVPLSCRRPRRITSIRIIIKSAVKTDELVLTTPEKISPRYVQ
jgi:hypothetical protein